MKKRLKFVIPVIVILIIISSIIYFREPVASKSVLVSGNIEITEVVLSFKIPGRLEQRYVDEGETVKQGQLVAKLESIDQKLAVSHAEASLSHAVAVLAELEAGSRQEDIRRANARVLQAQYTFDELKNGNRSQEITEVQAELNRALAASRSAATQYAQAKSDFDRFQSLFKAGSVSLHDYELYRTKYETAQHANQESQAQVTRAKAIVSLLQEGARTEEIKKSEAILNQVQAEYELIKSGPRKETIEQAQAQVNIAKAYIRQVQQQLTYTELFAPIDGVVLSKSVEPGEYLNTGSPVVTIGAVQRPWLRAYISEKYIGKIKYGDMAEVKTDSFPDKMYKGTIHFISSQAEFTPKAVQTFEEREKLMYRIKIDIPNSTMELKPGMPADARIMN
ncbi:MAG: efflux RND transporter periplasmic adaptor subunit [Desulfobacterales bacterium]|nr:efflux RND transporter periplasmic adaptor subunit [Desulfobacterales bacterium]